MSTKPGRERLVHNLLTIARQPGIARAWLGRSPSVSDGSTIASDWLMSAEDLAALPAGTAEALARYAGAHPGTLDALAKQSRKGVKRAVAGNPTTPRDTLLALLKWAVIGKDSDAVRELAGTLPPSVVLPQLAGRASLCGAWSVGVVAYVERTQDVDELRYAFAEAQAFGAASPLFTAAAHGRLPLSARTLYEAVGPETRDLIIANLFNNYGGSSRLDADAQLLIEEHLRERPTTRIDMSSRTGRPLLPTELEVLRQSDDPGVKRAVARGLARGDLVLDEQALAEFVDSVETPEAAHALLANGSLHKAFSGRQLARLCQLIGDSAPILSGVRRHTLVEKGADLSDNEVLAVLGDSWPWDGTVLDWLASENEGRAPVTVHLLRRYARRAKLVSGEDDDFDALSSLLVLMSEDMDPRTLRTKPILDLMNAAGAATLSIASGSQHTDLPDLSVWEMSTVEYIADRIVERFGDRPDVWALVPEVRPAPSVTIDQWLDMIAALVEQ